MTAPPLSAMVDPDNGLPALLLIHGMLSSSLHWQPNTALSQHFRLVRVDLPGHGASAPPRTPEEAQPGAIVAQFESLRETLGIAAWHVCGASFGAGLALRYAIDHPAACQRISFTNGSAALRDSWSDDELQAQIRLAAHIRDKGDAAVLAMPYHPAHARRFPPEFRAALVAEAARITPETVALFQQVALPCLTQRHRLGALRRPCLLINGLYEHRFQPLRNWLSEAHPAIGIVDLPGGHSVNIECPAAFDAALTDFLHGLKPE
ncbi:alpha/beta fold hydrolase [Pseudotabrizicola alkalilacus]|nr:alpha/beta fold hydrolase [Pseudotabrizicola alkalilacus]